MQKIKPAVWISSSKPNKTLRRLVNIIKMMMISKPKSRIYLRPIRTKWEQLERQTKVYRVNNIKYT